MIYYKRNQIAVIKLWHVDRQLAVLGSSKINIRIIQVKQCPPVSRRVLLRFTVQIPSITRIGLELLLYISILDTLLKSCSSMAPYRVLCGTSDGILLHGYKAVQKNLCTLVDTRTLLIIAKHQGLSSTLANHQFLLKALSYFLFRVILARRGEIALHLGVVV